MFCSLSENKTTYEHKDNVIMMLTFFGEINRHRQSTVTVKDPQTSLDWVGNQLKGWLARGRTSEKGNFNLIYPYQPSAPTFQWFYALFYTADPDLNQDPASLRSCLSNWFLHHVEWLV